MKARDFTLYAQAMAGRVKSRKRASPSISRKTDRLPMKECGRVWRIQAFLSPLWAADATAAVADSQSAPLQAVEQETKLVKAQAKFILASAGLDTAASVSASGALVVRRGAETDSLNARLAQ